MAAAALREGHGQALSGGGRGLSPVMWRGLIALLLLVALSVPLGIGPDTADTPKPLSLSDRSGVRTAPYDPVADCDLVRDGDPSTGMLVGRVATTCR